MSVITIEADEAAEELPRLLASVEQGDEVVLARAGQVIAPSCAGAATLRQPGFLKGEVWVFG